MSRLLTSCFLLSSSACCEVVLVPLAFSSFLFRSSFSYVIFSFSCAGVPMISLLHFLISPQRRLPGLAVLQKMYTLVFLVNNNKDSCELCSTELIAKLRNKWIFCFFFTKCLQKFQWFKQIFQLSAFGFSVRSLTLISKSFSLRYSLQSEEFFISLILEGHEHHWRP